MPAFDVYVEIVKSQLAHLQNTFPNTDVVILDEVWLRQRWEQIGSMPLAKMPNELVVAQEWEEERLARQKANFEAART